MLEKTVRKKIVDWAKEHGFLVRKYYGSPFSHVGTGDLILCYRGKFIMIEVKKPGKEPTEAQFKTIKEVLEHGGHASWFDNSSRAIGWLQAVKDTIDRESN